MATSDAKSARETGITPSDDSLAQSSIVGPAEANDSRTIAASAPDADGRCHTN